jgi:hypothetical protein
MDTGPMKPKTSINITSTPEPSLAGMVSGYNALIPIDISAVKGKKMIHEARKK